MTSRQLLMVLLTGVAAAAGAGIGPGNWEPIAVPTLPMVIGDASSIVRVKILDVPAEGALPVEVLEVYWGEFENNGFVDPSYLIPDETPMGAHPGRFEFRTGEQYVLFGSRGVGGVYKPYLYWNTKFGVADVVKGKVDLSRLAEGPREITIAEFREIVKAAKYGN
jgi:hypothetical protein